MLAFTLEARKGPLFELFNGDLIVGRARVCIQTKGIGLGHAGSHRGYQSPAQAVAAAVGGEDGHLAGPRNPLHGNAVGPIRRAPSQIVIKKRAQSPCRLAEMPVPLLCTYGRVVVVKRNGQDSASFDLTDSAYLFGRYGCGARGGWALTWLLWRGWAEAHTVIFGFSWERLPRSIVASSVTRRARYQTRLKGMMMRGVAVVMTARDRQLWRILARWGRL